MSAFWALARLRLLDVLRSASSTSFVLLFPVVLLVVVGFVFMNGHPFEERTIAVVAGPGAAERPLEALGGELDPARLVHVESEAAGLARLRARTASAVVVLPRGDGISRVLVGPRDRLFGRGIAASPGVRAELAVVELPRWGYVHYLFPGILTFSVMLAGLFATGYTMVLYRQNRFLKKLATTPMPKAAFVGAQIAARSVLVLGQIALVAAAGALLFDVPFTAVSALWVALVSLLGLLAFMGIGFVLACVLRTEDLVVDIVSAVNLPLVFLSEIFFPLDALPRPLAALGALLPSTHMVQLTREILLFGATDPGQLAGGIAVLAGWTVATFALSLRLFRWHR
ncbi:ABC transporter permease [Sorangium sp. So ce1014]|uniref:ABC transporter permease n=1 Tax=Sorangium sp. So ce1014 TaxID=3133326 RepID=UPI003F5EB46D